METEAGRGTSRSAFGAHHFQLDFMQHAGPNWLACGGGAPLTAERAANSFAEVDAPEEVSLEGVSRVGWTG